MALFGRGDKEKAETPQAQNASQVRPLPGHPALCRICSDRLNFSRCWLRVTMLTQCPCCGTPFPDPARVYAQTLPLCPRCGEYLEQPGFEYGLCDRCGSKHELIQGTKPSLLPNRQQRIEMEKNGKSWRRE